MGTARHLEQLENRKRDNIQTVEGAKWRKLLKLWFTTMEHFNDADSEEDESTESPMLRKKCRRVQKRQEAALLREQFRNRILERRCSATPGSESFRGSPQDSNSASPRTPGQTLALTAPGWESPPAMASGATSSRQRRRSSVGMGGDNVYTRIAKSRSRSRSVAFGVLPSTNNTNNGSQTARGSPKPGSSLMRRKSLGGSSFFQPLVESNTGNTKFEITPVAEPNDGSQTARTRNIAEYAARSRRQSTVMTAFLPDFDIADLPNENNVLADADEDTVAFQQSLDAYSFGPTVGTADESNHSEGLLDTVGEFLLDQRRRRKSSSSSQKATKRGRITAPHDQLTNSNASSSVDTDEEKPTQSANISNSSSTEHATVGMACIQESLRKHMPPPLQLGFLRGGGGGGGTPQAKAAHQLHFAQETRYQAGTPQTVVVAPTHISSPVIQAATPILTTPIYANSSMATWSTTLAFNRENGSIDNTLSVQESPGRVSVQRSIEFDDVLPALPSLGHFAAVWHIRLMQLDQVEELQRQKVETDEMASWATIQYEEAGDRVNMVVLATIHIQRFFRGWRGRKRVKGVKYEIRKQIKANLIAVQYKENLLMQSWDWDACRYETRLYESFLAKRFSAEEVKVRKTVESTERDFRSHLIKWFTTCIIPMWDVCESHLRNCILHDEVNKRRRLMAEIYTLGKWPPYFTLLVVALVDLEERRRDLIKFLQKEELRVAYNNILPVLGQGGYYKNPFGNTSAPPVRTSKDNQYSNNTTKANDVRHLDVSSNDNSLFNVKATINDISPCGSPMTKNSNKLATYNQQPLVEGQHVVGSIDLRQLVLREENERVTVVVEERYSRNSLISRYDKELLEVQRMDFAKRRHEEKLEEKAHDTLALFSRSPAGRPRKNSVSTPPSVLLPTSSTNREGSYPTVRPASRSSSRGPTNTVDPQRCNNSNYLIPVSNTVGCVPMDGGDHSAGDRPLTAPHVNQIGKVSMNNSFQRPVTDVGRKRDQQTGKQDSIVQETGPAYVRLLKEAETWKWSTPTPTFKWPQPLPSSGKRQQGITTTYTQKTKDSTEKPPPQVQEDTPQQGQQEGQVDILTISYSLNNSVTSTQTGTTSNPEAPNLPHHSNNNAEATSSSSVEAEQCNDNPDKEDNSKDEDIEDIEEIERQKEEMVNTYNELNDSSSEGSSFTCSSSNHSMFSKEDIQDGHFSKLRAVFERGVARANNSDTYSTLSDASVGSLQSPHQDQEEYENTDTNLENHQWFSTPATTPQRHIPPVSQLPQSASFQPPQLSERERAGSGSVLGSLNEITTPNRNPGCSWSRPPSSHSLHFNTSGSSSSISRPTTPISAALPFPFHVQPSPGATPQRGGQLATPPVFPSFNSLPRPSSRVGSRPNSRASARSLDPIANTPSLEQG